MMNAVLLAAAVLAPVALVNGQAAAYAQCGGIGFSGSTTCISGYTCSVVNDYYSQCLPGSASTTTGSSGGGGSTTTASVTTTAVASNTANPFSGKKQWANPYYASEVTSIAMPQMTDSALKTKAAAAAQVPSWTWLDTMAKVPSMQTYLQDMTAAGATDQIAPFVVYDLPERDCSAAASNGELSLANNGSALYMEYIDSIAAIIKQFPAITVALIIEPDSLANLVTNLNVAKCANAEDAYKTLTVYALQTLALDNVVMYMDGGHSGWLGWPANLPPAATLYASMWSQAGKPAQLRGLATNVANYNGWALASCPSYTQSNPNCDEQKYITAMSAQLAADGWSDTHFIVDQGRSGVQPTEQQAQGDWCNVVGVGFGIRPDTAPTNALLDAFVWVKPGGESDGTSNTSSTRYDYHCGLSDALQPAPEAGTWFQAMFVQLLTNANPSF